MTSFIDDLVAKMDRRFEELAEEREKLQAARKSLKSRPHPSDAPAPPPSPVARRGRPPRQHRQRKPGEALDAVLDALPKGVSLTASRIASATGLPVYTVNQALNQGRKLELIAKADRGYEATGKRRQPS